MLSAETKSTIRERWRGNADRDLEEGLFNEAVQSRGGGIWAGAIFGFIYGAIAGAAIAALPMIFGFGTVTTAGFLGAMALCASLGALGGRSHGGENGSAAGAATGSTKILLKEMRDQFSAVHQELDAIKDATGLSGAVPKVELPEKGKAEAMFTENKPSYFKPWQTIATTYALSGAVGLAVYGAANLLGGDVAGGMASNVMQQIGYGASPATSALGAALMGMASGGIFVVNVPRISSELHMWARGAINGRVFGRDLQNERTVEQQVQAERDEGIAPVQAARPREKSYLAQLAAERSAAADHTFGTRL